jgi:hypothetical protein
MLEPNVGTLLIQHIQNALLDTPEEAAMIRENIRQLREYFGREQRKAA